ncbi:MAG: AAA family ATPase [Candidatus Weimeria sp.]
MERLLPTSVQTFETLREKNMVYVDKTGYIEKLRRKSREIFLSRPRRFGKSLFTSTLEAYFLGKKELFSGLEISAIEEKKGDEAWKTYPVIPFYLASGEYNRDNGLEDILGGVLESCTERYGLTGDYTVIGETLPGRFRSLLERLYQKTGNHVVILIDEYDSPLLKAEDPNQEKKKISRSGRREKCNSTILQPDSGFARVTSAWQLFIMIIVTCNINRRKWK